jgi:hypothetical protein
MISPGQGFGEKQEATVTVADELKTLRRKETDEVLSNVMTVAL